MNRFAVFLCLSLSCTPVVSQGVDFGQFGESSFQILKLHLSARLLGLSGAGAGLPGSTLEATESNPATSNLDSGVLIPTHGKLYKEFEGSVSSLTWGIPAGRYNAFVHTRFLGFDEIDSYDDINTPRPSYSAHAFKVQLGFAGEIYGIHWGLSTSYVENNIAYANYRTWVGDVGLLYSPFQNFWIGGAVNNGDLLTSKLVNDKSEKPIPPTIGRLGASYIWNIIKDYKLTFVADARTRNDEKLNFPMGLEFTWAELISLRGGFPLMEPEPFPSFGVGVQWNGFKLDYALQQHETLSPGHFWTLGVYF